MKDQTTWVCPHELQCSHIFCSQNPSCAAQMLRQQCGGCQSSWGWAAIVCTTEAAPSEICVCVHYSQRYALASIQSLALDMISDTTFLVKEWNRQIPDLCICLLLQKCFFLNDKEGLSKCLWMHGGCKDCSSISLIFRTQSLIYVILPEYTHL